MFVLDMFPYPSGAGLHVGHPLGYIATDVFARFNRMSGRNVLHAMGYDAFGLPAEQYAVQTGQHPRVTTEANIANMRRQLRALGLGHDPRRGPVYHRPCRYYRWTQWIFLQIYNSWYDADADKARPIETLVDEFRDGQVRDADRASRSTTWASPNSASSSTRTGSRTSPRRRSTGARRWARCWRTRRSRPTVAATAATTPSTSGR